MLCCLCVSFLVRYKPLCPDTWPNWRGSAAEGVQRLIKHLGYKRDEYKMGRYADRDESDVIGSTLPGRSGRSCCFHF